MSVLNLVSLIQAGQEEGLTAAEMLSSIPHDAAAIVVYVLVGFSVGLVVWSGRKSAGGEAPRRDD